MTTPGPLDGYVDLTLYDVDVVELIDRALSRMLGVFPDWTPREGNVEVVLLEALALEVQELVYAVNRLPATVTELLLRLFELQPSAGTAPTATLTFTVQASGAASIPEGTQVALVLAGGLDPVIFRTTGEAVIAAGATTVTAPAVATRPTTDANAATPGTPAVVLDAVSYVNAVTVTITGAGAAPEDTAAFLDRGVARFRRLSTTLVRPEHYTAAALEVPEVHRATTLDRYDPTQNPPVGRRGHMTVAVAGTGAAPLSSALKVSIETNLERQGHSGIDVHVIDTTDTLVPVSATVTAYPGNDTATVRAAVLAALAGYLNGDVWPFGGTVYRNELIALLDRVPGVDLVNVTSPGADVQLAGAAPLARFDPSRSVITVT